jgi:predicted nucleic acid-binding Zn ribbon protein
MLYIYPVKIFLILRPVPLKKKEKSGKLIHISDILTAALARYRPAMDTQMTKIWDIWDEAVGKAIAMNAKPASFKDGILIINVSSSAWIHQLKFLEQEMILNINKQLDLLLVKQLRFKIGKILS